MPRENEKEKSNNKVVLTAILPILLALLALLVVFLPRIQIPSHDDNQPIFTYDFRLGAYPANTSGEATIIEESGHFNLCFDAIGERFWSGPITSWRTLTIDIYISGLNLVGSIVNNPVNPIFTLAGYDAQDALVRIAAVTEVTTGVATRVTMTGQGISYFQLIMADFAYEEENPNLALGVLISHMIGYDRP
ncbi:MAG: hypothetical protein WC399_01080 [Bacilli bacterium]|jgi:hypothetical protein